MFTTRSTRQSSLALALAVTAGLILAGCSASPSEPAPEQPPASEVNEQGSGEQGSGEQASGEATLPADFPADILISDGELIAASGSAGSWQLVKSMQLVDQARVAVDSNVTSYGFTIDEFVDGDLPSWTISNDAYVVVVEVMSGEPFEVSWTVDAR